MSEVEPLAGTVGRSQDWDELPLDPPPVRVARPARPAWITVVAIILALNGISLILYAGYILAIPVWAPDPLPVIGAITGLFAFAAAYGVFRQLAWGRWLGVALAVGWLARDAVLFEAWLRTGFRGMDPSAPNVLFDVALPVAVYAIIVELLIRRWPART